MPKSAARFRDGDGEGEGERRLSASCKRETSNRDSVVPPGRFELQPQPPEGESDPSASRKLSQHPRDYWDLE